MRRYPAGGSASHSRIAACISADVGGRRRQAGADGPHRLVGNDRLGNIVRHRAVELRAHNHKGAAGLAFGARLADANDREQTRRGAPRRLLRAPFHRFRRDRCRRSEWPTMTAAAPASLQHFRRYVAGISAAEAAGGNPGRRSARASRARPRRSSRSALPADRPSNRLWEGRRGGDDFVQLAGGALQTVHFPVAGEQRAAAP